MTKQYISVTEAAQMLQKTRQWVWVLIISGRLDANKVGGRYIISTESVINYFNNNK
jgi:excisionase family DNA binding protein